jgi:hypothetical protein
LNIKDSHHLIWGGQKDTFWGNCENLGLSNEDESSLIELGRGNTFTSETSAMDEFFE